MRRWVCFVRDRSTRKLEQSYKKISAKLLLFLESSQFQLIFCSLIKHMHFSRIRSKLRKQVCLCLTPLWKRFALVWIRFVVLILHHALWIIVYNMVNIGGKYWIKVKSDILQLFNGIILAHKGDCKTVDLVAWLPKIAKQAQQCSLCCRKTRYEGNFHQQRDGK